MALNGDVRVTGTVEEAVVAVNGRAVVEPGGRVNGDVVSSRPPRVAPGATVGGETSGVRFSSRALGALAWLVWSQPPSVIVQPTPRHLDLVSGLHGQVGSGANLVNDAHLAALALQHGARVVTYDSDFGRFEGVRWEPPGRPDGTAVITPL